MKKLRVELHKQGIHKQDNGSYKCRKMGTNLHNARAEKENKAMINGINNNQSPMVGSNNSIEKEGNNGGVEVNDGTGR